MKNDRVPLPVFHPFFFLLFIYSEEEKCYRVALEFAPIGKAELEHFVRGILPANAWGSFSMRRGFALRAFALPRWMLAVSRPMQ